MAMLNNQRVQEDGKVSHFVRSQVCFFYLFGDPCNWFIKKSVQMSRNCGINPSTALGIFPEAPSEKLYSRRLSRSEGSQSGDWWLWGPTNGRRGVISHSCFFCPQPYLNVCISQQGILSDETFVTGHFERKPRCLREVYPLVNKHSYWTSPFIVDLPIKNVIFHSHVNVYQRFFS